MKNRKTSSAIARKASRVLKNNASSKIVKSVAASALSQRAPLKIRRK